MMWLYSCFSLDENINNIKDSNHFIVDNDEVTINRKKHHHSELLAYCRIDKMIISTGDAICEYIQDEDININEDEPAVHVWSWPEYFSPSQHWIEDETKVNQIIQVEKDFHLLCKKNDYYFMALKCDFPLDKSTIMRYIEGQYDL